MPTFPPSFLEEIRTRLPLSGYIGTRVRLVRAGREFKGCCPFHNEKTPSFYVNDDKQFFHCFGCGAHGDVIGFAMRHDRMNFPEAVESLAGQAGLPIPRDTPMEREKFDAEKRLYQLLDRATVWFEEQLFAPAGREALAYLRKRGLSDEAIRRFRLGYAPQDGQGLLRALTSRRHPREGGDPSLPQAKQEKMDPRLRGDDANGFTIEDLAAVGLAKKAEDRKDYYSFFRNRVIFPVGDRSGRTVAFGARILGEGEPKYLNSPDHALFHKGRLLYGLSRARTALSQGQPIIVVEGYMDVIALVEAGYSGAVAPLGTALTDEQIQTLWKLLPPETTRDPTRDYSPILCFDGDNAGLRAAARAVERALPLLTSAQTLRIATMAGAKDPDELIRQSGRGAFDALMKQALPMIDMLWNLALSGRQMRTPEERASFTATLKRQTAQIKDENLRALYNDAFKKRIDEAFGWKPQQNFSGQKNFRGKPMPAPYLEARRPPQSGQRMMEKILLALLINHPELFDEFGESLANLDFLTAEFDAIRQNAIDHFSQTHDTPPTAEELRRALTSTSGDFSPFDYEQGGSALDEILAPDTYLHCKAAKPDAAPDEARKAWISLWQRLEQDKVKADYAAARATYQENPSEENEHRMKALQERITQFATDAS